MPLCMHLCVSCQEEFFLQAQPVTFAFLALFQSTLHNFAEYDHILKGLLFGFSPYSSLLLNR